MKNNAKVIVRMVSAAMLALLGLAGGARAAMAAGDTDEASDKAEASSPTEHATAPARHVRMTGTVADMDKRTRNLVIMDDKGERMSIRVPQSVKGFDKISEGDRVALNYRGSIAVAVQRPGDNAKPGKAGQASNGTSPPACEGNVRSSANVVSVDPAHGTLTFRGAANRTETVTAVDPAVEEKLGTLHPGDLIDLTYTEPVASSIALLPAKK